MSSNFDYNGLGSAIQSVANVIGDLGGNSSQTLKSVNFAAQSLGAATIAWVVLSILLGIAIVVLLGLGLAKLISIDNKLSLPRITA